MATTLTKLFPPGILQSAVELDEIALQDTPPVTGLHYLITFYNNNFRLNFIEQSSWVNFTAQMNIGDAVYATHGSSGRLYYGVITAFEDGGGLLRVTYVTNPLGHPNFFGTYDGQSTYFEVGGLTNFAGVRVSPNGLYARQFDEVSLIPSIGLGLTGSVSVNERGYGIALDSSGNRYGVGNIGDTPTSKFCLIKNDTTGAVSWQRELTGSEIRTQGFKVVTDSSGNVYAAGLDELNSSPFTKWLVIVKFNSSGAIQWQRRIDTNNNTIGTSIALDSSNNVYIVSSDYSSSSSLIAFKYDSNGNIQWQRKFYSNTGGTIEGRGVAVDSAGNLYACGTAFGKAIIVKFNTSGVYQWVYSLGGESPQSTYSFGITVDSSDNLYMVGNVYNSVSAKQEMLLFKLNSSGTQQWQRTLGSNSTNTYGYATTVDSSGNVYVTGMTNDVWDIYIAKYNTTGTLQWQRTLGSTAYEIGQSIAVSSTGEIHLTGLTNVSGTEDIFFATLPSDGSRTGNHTIGGYNFSYSASSMTTATSSLSYTSGTPGQSTSNTTPSLTESAGVLTIAVSTLTVTTISAAGTITAERKTSTGTYMVGGYFNEITLSPSNITSQSTNDVSTSTSFVVPSGVTRISAVVIGGGGQGAASLNSGNSTSGAGGGGGLSWKNNIPVTPGETLTVVVGAGGSIGSNYIGSDGAASYIARGGTTLLLANGGKGGVGNNGIRPNWEWLGGLGGTGGANVDASYGGGNGGRGGNGTIGSTNYRAGGGGAGGYSGNGGTGGNAGGSYNPGGAGSGGGGGGGASTPGGPYSGGGGGTGVNGEGTSGAGGGVTTILADSINGCGKGGSGGDAGGSGGYPEAVGTIRMSGGRFGGGGAGSDGGLRGNGAPGAVRIIWGLGREFPSSDTGDQ